MRSKRFFILASFLVSSLFAFSSTAKADKTYKLRVTNTTGRQLKISWGCESNGKITKKGSKEFPGSKGETKPFTTNCTPHIKMQAKIVTNWQKVRIYYSTAGTVLPNKNTVEYISKTSSTGYVLYLYLGATGSEDRICLYVHESGIVKAFPRACP